MDVRVPLSSLRGPDPAYFEKTWQLLKQALQQIWRKNQSNLSFEELYRSAYNLTQNKFGDQLEQNLHKLLAAQMQDLHIELIRLADKSKFLDKLGVLWEEHHLATLLMRDVLLYFDRQYLKPRDKAVFDISLKFFCDILLRDPPTFTMLREKLLDMIHRERTNEPINRPLLRKITSMLVLLSLGTRDFYIEVFEREFRKRSVEFFVLERSRLLQEGDACAYLRKSEARLNEELVRVDHCLDMGTHPLIKKIVEEELLKNAMREVLVFPQSGLVAMLDGLLIDDLKRVYRLLKPVDGGHAYVKSLLLKYIEERGNRIFFEEEKEKEEKKDDKTQVRPIELLVEFKAQCNQIWNECFEKDLSFDQTIKNGFISFLNAHKKVPELMSLFLDHKMRKGEKEGGEQNVKQSFELIMEVYRLLQDKDMFERYYQKHLAKRLLSGKGVNDHEETMLSLLKVECQYQYVSKLEKMFKDIHLSGDISNDYREFQAGKKADIGLHIKILTTGTWPSRKQYNIPIPRELDAVCDAFKGFYLSRFSGRKLTWDLGSGSADVSASYDKKYTVTVPSLLLVILLQFNEAPKGISVKDLMATTQLSLADIHQQILPLLASKSKLLNKTPDGKKFESDADVLEINEAFKSEKRKITLGLAVAKETPAERKDTEAGADNERAFVIQAAIVRIMKTRKTLNQAEITAETIEALAKQFKPHPKAIKQQIETLIEKEYLKRAEAPNVFEYLA